MNRELITANRLCLATVMLRGKFSASPNHSGWTTILGQIDPGPFEEEIVAAEAEREPSLVPDWTPAPADYWKSWREECDACRPDHREFAMVEVLPVEGGS